MALVDLDGTLDGLGDIAGTAGLSYYLADSLPGSGDVAGSPTYWVLLGGSLSGSAVISAPALIQTFLVGGQAFGFGTVQDLLDLTVSGLAQGTGDIQGGLVLLSTLAGSVSGFGTIVGPGPEYLQGQGNLVAFMEVTQQLPSICHPPGDHTTLGYGQVLGPGDLTFCLCDASGQRYTPWDISYTLYQVMPGGYQMLRGPENRTPVVGPCGCYYATGTAGECGQPGTWAIEWAWQRTFDGEWETATYFFCILDNAKLNPCDPNRIHKFGWDC